MFRSRTVILVGAGASAEFGIPTGLGVFKDALDIQSGLSLDRVQTFSFSSGFREYLSRHSDHKLEAGYDVFLQRVQSAVSPSIDRLAWLNEDVSEHCRAFSAWSILKSHYEESVGYDLAYLDSGATVTHKKKCSHLYPFVGSHQNWIAKCADKWLGVAENADGVWPERLSFVTFNYDLLIEEAFAHFVHATRRFGDLSSSKMPEVIHVHGAFPKMPDVLSESYVHAAQRCIKYIEDGGDAPAVQRAKDHLMSASHIIVVGFDFDEKNVELLNLRDFARRMHVLNFDGNEALENRIQSLGVQEDRILRGTFEKPIGVSQAGSRGFFDRPELIGRSILDAL